MSFSSRRRNYLLTPHRRDGLIEWMKSMLMHSFVLDALDTTAADTFSHFEILIEEHRELSDINNNNNGNINSLNAIDETNGGRIVSRLKQLVPTVGTFHTPLPLRKAFLAYNAKYALTKRRHICISFNELRHICNLAQIMAIRDADKSSCSDDDEYDEHDHNWYDSARNLNQAVKSSELQQQLQKPQSCSNQSPDSSSHDDAGKSSTPAPYTPPSSHKEYVLDQMEGENKIPINSHGLKECSQLRGPKMITFDGDQTLYSDGANFESNPRLANYLYLLLRHKVIVAVVTAAGYEYQTEKYELRLSGLLAYFRQKGLPAEDCERFYLFGGECNYLLSLGHDYKLHPVKEWGAGGWLTSTKFIQESPANWEEEKVNFLLDEAEASFVSCLKELKIRGRVIRKKRSVGLIPNQDEEIPREALDENVIRVQTLLESHANVSLPFCAFNGGRDAWVDVGNKRVGVHILAAYLGTSIAETLHIGDQFLNTGNDYAARDICPCIWITSPEETTYILKSILRLAGISYDLISDDTGDRSRSSSFSGLKEDERKMDMEEVMRRHSSQTGLMDVYTGELIGSKSNQNLVNG